MLVPVKSEMDAVHSELVLIRSELYHVHSDDSITKVDSFNINQGYIGN
jgi:hypothetical protein